MEVYMDTEKNSNTIENNVRVVETEADTKKIATQFGAISWTYWLASCFAIYQTTFLVERGWDSARIGIINSTNSAVGAIASPFWGAVSDKRGTIKKILVLLIIVVSCLFPLIPLAAGIEIGGFCPVFLLFPMVTFFRNPLNSLIDNWTVRSCNRHGLRFGMLRSFGSVSFGIVGVLLGFIVPKINASSKSGTLGTIITFPLYSFFNIALLLLILSVNDDFASTGKKRQKLKDMHFEQLTGNYYYMSYLIYSIIIQIPLSCVLSFFTFLLKEIDVDLNMIGYVQGLKAFIEVPMLLLMDKIRNKCPLYYMLMGSGFLYMMEALLYSRATSFTEILFYCMLQGLAGGLHIAAGSNYVATLAPDNLKATAQTLNGSMVSIAGIIGNAIGGVVINRIGIRPFYRISALVLFCAIILYALSFPFGEKVLKKPRPAIVLHGAGYSH